ncbi:NADH-ubiquinone oxidoreductase 213 kDa subunit [Talaromyces stipitatus ATCC 10500]|uniref:NADH-ubiquinone oxidoreductase 213 kDa subunit n=1 Tax=Talaromyces stipitatus (strain ATCC 10500 / CBS 375.48 / QM 6759 / NRRL 1006) TaxID=441959 RepID=B8M9A1_TALSN|nr:NADH-ubiquinone oxidoreductase 213 kDa subunit [Talaromyces stipitatus ATCC 10500]EED17661.1 NADH-ubiquinone oxidoreductase 213 kDa subunit [Talaromyces stipitatus ATCC 10500]
MASQHTENNTYHPRDAIDVALKSTALTGGFGLVASAVQNTLAKQNVGSLGIFLRSGSTIAIFAAMGGTYSFVRTASANLREKDDTWNTALGGFFAGSILGLRVRSFPSVFGYGTGLAATLATFEYTGGSLFGKPKDHNLDKYEELERLRKNYRTPAEQTFTELGEGRGIYAPGYAERRRERIKEAYGIDVPVTPPPAS